MKTLHYSIIAIFIIFVSGFILADANAMAYNDASGWSTLNVTGKFLYSNPPKPDQTFKFQYMVVNGILENSTVNQLGSYTYSLNSTIPATFELKIPKNYPYSNIGSPIVTVSVNNVQLNPQQYSFLPSDCFFEFSIPFSNKSIVSISFTRHLAAEPFEGDDVPQYCANETVVPEFPFAIPVLLVAISSLIVFYRLKFRQLNS